MKKRRKFNWHIPFFAGLISLVLAFSFFLAWGQRLPVEKPVYGVTFSTMYAEQLGIDWQQAFRALIDEIGVRDFRIPVYWSETEPQNNQYDFKKTDWLIKEAENAGARVTLAIGAKVPRWPECFIPDWVDRYQENKRHEELLEYLEVVVKRYQNSPAITRWQVENEPFFPFGICPSPNVKHFEEEIRLIRSLDSRPIQQTVSGELDPWFDAAFNADIVGVSMYRVTWNDLFGYFYYPITPGFYAKKANAISPWTEKVVISELQAEPWFPEAVENRTPAEWYQVFPAEFMERNIDFAHRTGLSEAYLWGAEWWYFLRENGEDRLWNTAKETFNPEN